MPKPNMVFPTPIKITNHKVGNLKSLIRIINCPCINLTLKKNLKKTKVSLIMLERQPEKDLRKSVTVSMSLIPLITAVGLQKESRVVVKQY